jgi:hypothetical protein
MELVIKGNYKPNLLHEELAAAGVNATLSFFDVPEGKEIILEFDEAQSLLVQSLISTHNPGLESHSEKQSRRYEEAVSYLKAVDWEGLKTEILALPAAQRSILVPLAKSVRALAIIASQLDKEIN